MMKLIKAFKKDFNSEDPRTSHLIIYVVLTALIVFGFWYCNKQRPYTNFDNEPATYND